MPPLQQIISRIQSGELTRENDRVGQGGFSDFIEKDINILHDIDYCSDTFWDLYETMAKEKLLIKLQLSQVANDYNSLQTDYYNLLNK